MILHYYSKTRRYVVLWLLSLLFLASCAILNIYLSHLLGIEKQFDSFLAELTFFKAFYLEIAFIILLLAGSKVKNKVLSSACIFFSACCIIIWIIQLNTLRHSDDFMSLFLLENIGSISLVLNRDTILHSFILLLIPLGFSFFFYFSIRASGGKEILGNFSLILIIAICIMIIDNNFDNSNNKIRCNLKIRDNSPGLAFLSMIGNFQDMIAEGEIDFKVRRLLRVSDMPEYPMINEVLYTSPFPFPLKDGKTQLAVPPNIIVFFAESLSARKLSPYKNMFASDAPAAREDLTPNIAQFAQRAMTVEGYFSHTFSTFRGLRGQNCSMFPYHGGDGAWTLPQFKAPVGPYQCLPHHLVEDGYETLFFGPDHEGHCNFSFQTEQMGFERNIFRGEIEEKYLRRKGTSKLHLTDQELMVSLIAFLKERDTVSDTANKAFYLATYPKGCHVGLNNDIDGCPYKDGKNRVYNTIHSWDKAFGYFWNEFQKLDLSKNTILIVTGDHSHWPERAYIEIAGSDYSRQCFEELGLLIYSPLHELPARYDAGNATSLGFAPMVAQILAIDPERQNSFLGFSPFERKKENAGVGWANQTLFLIEQDKKPRCFDIQDENNVKVRNLWHAIHLTHIAELNGKMIFSE